MQDLDIRAAPSWHEPLSWHGPEHPGTSHVDPNYSPLVCFQGFRSQGPTNLAGISSRGEANAGLSAVYV